MSDFTLIYTTIAARPEAEDNFIVPTFVESSILDNNEDLNSTEDGLPRIVFSRGSIRDSHYLSLGEYI